MENPNADLPYRPNVGIVVFNKEGLTLLGERLDHLGAWQFPQGGVDEGEDFAAAARRELWEETGIQARGGAEFAARKDAAQNGEQYADFIFETPGFLYYDFPPSLKIPRMTDRYRGQKQKWFLAYWNQPVEKADLKKHTQEFARVAFMPMAEATNQIVPFKRDIYAELERIFLPRIDDYLRSR